MKSPKGFGKKYFSLAAILAFSAGAVMASGTQSVVDNQNNSFHKKIGKDSDETDEPIIISKKVEVKEVDATFASEVYTQKDIKNSHSKDLYDFINSQTSLNISSSYGNSFAPRIDMRGYGIGDGYENIVVTVNGRRLNNIDMSPQLLSSIPIDSIKRIEILKGNGSVEYGDGANAGVINIITKDFKGVSFGSYMGTHGLVHVSSNFGVNLSKKVLIEGFIDHTKSDGDKIISTDGTKDKSKNDNKGFKITYKPTDKLTLYIGKTFSNLDINYANALTLSQFELDPKTVPAPSWGTKYTRQKYDTSVLSGGFKYKIDKRYSIEAKANKEKKSSDYLGIGSGYENKNNYTYDSYNTKLNYQNSFVKAVIGVQKFDGERKGTNDTTKDNLGFYIRSVFSYKSYHLSLGARSEKVKYEFKNSTSDLSHDDSLQAYEIGINKKLGHYSSLFANYNRSFESPNIDRLFTYNFSTFVYEFNGFIKPMKVNNYNLGYTYTGYPNKLKLTFFYADVKDEIYFNALPWPGSNTNLDKTRKYGFELEDKYNIHYNLFTKLNYSFVDTKIRKNSSNPAIEGNEIPGVPKHNIKITLGYRPDYKTTLLLTHIYRSKAYAMSDFDKSYGKMKSYNSTNLTLSYKVKRFNLFAKINNVFDKKNALFADNGSALGVYPTNYERTFLFGVSVKF